MLKKEVKRSILIELKINFSLLRYLMSLLVIKILYQKNEPDVSPAFFTKEEERKCLIR